MSQDDPRHPFDADRFLEGFTVEERQVPVDPASPLGKAMAEARERGIPTSHWISPAGRVSRSQTDQ